MSWYKYTPNPELIKQANPYTEIGNALRTLGKDFDEYANTKSKRDYENATRDYYLTRNKAQEIENSTLQDRLNAEIQSKTIANAKAQKEYDLLSLFGEKQRQAELDYKNALINNANNDAKYNALYKQAQIQNLKAKEQALLNKGGLLGLPSMQELNTANTILENIAKTRQAEIDNSNSAFSKAIDGADNKEEAIKYFLATGQVPEVKTKKGFIFDDKEAVIPQYNDVRKEIETLMRARLNNGGLLNLMQQAQQSTTPQAQQNVIPQAQQAQQKHNFNGNRDNLSPYDLEIIKALMGGNDDFAIFN